MFDIVSIYSVNMVTPILHVTYNYYQLTTFSSRGKYKYSTKTADIVNHKIPPDKTKVLSFSLIIYMKQCTVRVKFS